MKWPWIELKLLWRNCEQFLLLLQCFQMSPVAEDASMSGKRDKQYWLFELLWNKRILNYSGAGSLRTLKCNSSNSLRTLMTTYMCFISRIIYWIGESNSGASSKYYCLFPAMIDDWRMNFHSGSQNQTSRMFPFGFVQVRLHNSSNRCQNILF